MLIERIDATGTSARPTDDLPSNRVVFWRLRGRIDADTSTRVSSTWQLRTGLLSASADTAHGLEADFNGDGFSDLGVGDVAANSNRGSVSIHYGSPTGLNSTPERVINGAVAFEGFGAVVASVGDVNGDGFIDLAVSSPTRTVAMRTGAGAIDIYFGSDAGISATPSQTLTGSSGGDFGAMVVGLSDVNGDGFGDVAIGHTVERLGSRRSTISVHLGTVLGLASTPTQSFDDGFIGSFNGEAIAIGDANGDQRQDLLLFGPGGVNPRTFAGTREGVSSTPSSVLSVARSTLRAAGDINADGLADISSSSLGEARYLLGSVDWRWVESSTVGTRAGGFVGDAAALGGDINGDGYADLVFAIETGAPAQAQLAVFRGSASGLRASTLGFGSATGVLMLRARGDFNGDGLADIVASSNGRASVWMGAMLSAPLGPQMLSSGRAITP
jgi:hypothetical protein